MRKRFDDILERKVIEEIVKDSESGYEVGARRVQESVRSPDGLAIESKETRRRELMACNHLFDVGTPIAACAICSKQKGHPVYVCERCSVQCPMTGILVCKRHAVPGLDGRYYSPAGLKQAKKLGLFKGPQSQGGGGKATGLLGTLVAFLRWW